MPKLTESGNVRATARYLEGLGLLESFRGTRDWNKLEAAELQFTEATQIDPFYKAARFYLGVSQEMIGKHEEAANEFERLRSEGETNGQPDLELLYNLSLSYFHQYRRPAYQHAEKYLKYLLELTSQTILGNKTDEQSVRRESVRLLAGTVLAQVYSHLSIVPVGVSKEEFRPQAEYYFSLAIETAEYFLAEFREGHFEPELRRDIGWGLHNATGHALLYAFRRNGEKGALEASIKEFAEALQFDPENYRVLSNLGSSYLFLAEWERKNGGQVGHEHIDWEKHLDLAEQSFRRVLDIKPNYDFAFARLAKIALMRGHWQEAKRNVELAGQNSTEMPPGYLDSLLAEIEQAQASAATPIS